jgi:hypothetical protein
MKYLYFQTIGNFYCLSHEIIPLFKFEGLSSALKSNLSILLHESIIKPFMSSSFLKIKENGYFCLYSFIHKSL